MKANQFSAALCLATLGGCAGSNIDAVEPPNESAVRADQSISAEVSARKQLVRSALSKLKARSLYSNSVDWEAFDDELEAQIADIQTDEDMKRPLENALNYLRDPHARFFYEGGMFAAFTDWGNERNRTTRFIDQGLKRRFELEHSHHFEMLEGQTGYIKIKGIFGGDLKQQASLIRSNLEALASKGAKNWILDLRYNTGGNMHPMMSGLGPLLCNGVVGGEADADGNITGKWTVKDGDFFVREYNEISLPASEGIDCDADVAVLISRYTISSGEAVATTFKGRKNSAFFGEATGGLITGTNWEPIDDKLTMSIAVNYYADRNSNVFTKNLTPDQQLEFSPEVALNLDPAVKAAGNWLRQRLAQ